MRKLAIIALLFTGCLSSAHPAATRAETRFEIARAIAADSHGGASRSIVEMRSVTDDRAIVVTEQGTDASTRRQETWVRDGDGWKLAGETVADGAR
jgi:hypothetical protein